MSPLGINVDRAGKSPLPDLESLGSKWNRIVAHPSESIRGYLAMADSYGAGNLLVLDHDSAMEGRANWTDAVWYWKQRYGEYVDAWQILNEPDAGWDHASQLDAALRAPDHPSSWCMNPDEVSWRLREARDVLGPDAYVVGPGLSSGQPEYSDYVDWSPVNAIACHPYAKAPGSIELNRMISAYKSRAISWGLDLWVTEYDSRTPGMHRWMASDPRVQIAITFCYSDDMVDDFGLITSSGHRKTSYHEFRDAASAGPKFQLGFLEIAQKHPEIVGDPLEDESGFTPGVSFQWTDRGFLIAADVNGAGWKLGFVGNDGARYLWETWGLRRVA